MANDLGRFMTSRAFVERANVSVAKAVEDLEAKGIKPVFVTRQPRIQAHPRTAAADTKRGSDDKPARRKVPRAA